MRRELKAEEEAEEREAAAEALRQAGAVPPADRPASGDGSGEGRGEELAAWKEAGSLALQYQRFTRLNRALHILMIVSFISLALTGMTLKFSYTGWAGFLARLLGGYEGAGFIHRAAATSHVRRCSSPTSGT